MSNVVVSKKGEVALIGGGRWTPEEIELIKDTVAKGATMNELKLFLYRCKVMDLDPLKPGLVHFIKYGNNPGVPVVGIDGMRSKAAKTGKHRGTKRGVIKDEKGKLTGGWAEVKRADWDYAVREEVQFEEYTTGRNNWIEMPETMIKKVAEAAALRMAFPDELGGVYSKDEMEKQMDAPPSVYPDQPGPNDGVLELAAPYRIPAGEYAKRSLEEVGPENLKRVIKRIEEKAEKQKVPIPPMWQEFIARAEEYIGSLESAPLDPTTEDGADFADFKE